jgi:hypothetical protein
LVCNDGFADAAHEVDEIVHIVYAEQMCTGGFFGGNVVDVGARETESSCRGRAADCALAVWVYGGKVVGVGGVAQV